MVDLKTNRPSSIEYVKPTKMRDMAKKGFDMRQVEKLSKAMASVMSKNMLKAKPDSKSHTDIALEDNRRQMDLMKIDIGIINANVSALQQDVKSSLGMLSEAINSIKKIGSSLKEHANKIMANQNSSSSSVLDMLSGAGLMSGLKTAGSAIKSGVTGAVKGVAKGLGSASKFAKGLGAVGMAGSVYEAYEFNKEQSKELEEKYGPDWKKKLGPAAQNASRTVTDREATLEEINRLTPDEAKSVLENGYPKDIERYGKDRLETRAKGEKVSAPTKSSGGPEESKAVREKRDEVDKQERIEKSIGTIAKDTQTNKSITEQANAGKDGILKSNIKPVSETGNATRAMQSFIDSGWSKEQAAGIVGNLQQESATLKTDDVGDGGKAYGIAQWHPDRQADFLRVYKKDIRTSNFEEQLEFIKWELANSHAAAGRMLRQAKTAADAAVVVDNHYEKSDRKSQPQRIANAENLAKTSVAAPQNPNTAAPAAPGGAQANMVEAAGGSGVAPQVSLGELSSTGTATPMVQPSVNRATSASPLPDHSEGSQTKAGAAQLAKFDKTGRPDGLNLKQEFAGSLGSFLNTAQQSGHNITIQSGFRSPELQSILFKQAVQKYGNETEARKWVAPPGQSNHGKGIAADLGYSSPSAKSWAHSNAQKFGLNFRMAHEPWHIEPSGVGGSSVDYNPDGVRSASPAASAVSSASSISSMSGSTATNESFSKILSLTSGAPEPIVRPSSVGTGLVSMPPIMSDASAGPLVGLVGAIANIGSMVGSMSGVLGALSGKPGYTDAMNPDFMQDGNARNAIPPAMPSNRMLAQLFDLNVGDRRKIPGYAFG